MEFPYDEICIEQAIETARGMEGATRRTVVNLLAALKMFSAANTYMRGLPDYDLSKPLD